MCSVVRKMKEKFDKYQGDCNLLLSIAAILDPRNKMQMIEWCFPLIYSRGDSIEQVTTICETLRMLYKEYLEAYRARGGEEEGRSENPRESSSLGVKGKSRGRAEFYSYIRNIETLLE